MTTGRVPPNDLAAEAAVVSAVLLDARALDQVLDCLRPEHCYNDANRYVLEAAIELSRTGVAADAVTVAGWLEDRGRLRQVGGRAYLAWLADETPAVRNVADHARIVYEKWRLRELLAACHRILAEGYGEVTDVGAFLDASEQAVFDVAQKPSGSTTEHVSKPLKEAFEQIAAAAERGDKVTGVATGFVDFDALTAGLHDGELIIVAGRPGMGKTALALQFGLNAAKKDNGVAVFSQEMRSKELAVRLLCSEARVDVLRARRGDLGRSEWARIADAAGKVSQLPVWLDDSPAGVLEIRGKVRRLKAAQETRGASLRLVVVDYLQLLKGRDDAPTREQEISEISRGLKQLAKEVGVPIVALSQLNRSLESRPDKRPLLSDLRESGALEQDADVVVFVYRDDYYNKDSADRGKAELIIAKQRSGPTETVALRFQASCARFDTLADLTE
ncbi:MAG TPA: replicative DNA helicase [Candidatus Nanopelagicales bacterium]|nr:replicative DNA helicase [Candidatus Nanopelagicales bacterium]